jgi:hypothetical protein
MAPNANTSTWSRIQVHAAVAYMLLLGGAAQAKSLMVAPPHYKWDGVKAGTRTEMPCTIRITNLSEQPRSYKLSARNCADSGLTPSGGCEDIPNASWVALERRFVTVKAGQRVQVKVYLDIPGGRQYTGKSWQCYVEVREDVPQYGYLQGQPDLFALAVFLKVVISTVGPPIAAEPNSTTFTPMLATGEAPGSVPGHLPPIPSLDGWLYCGTVTDMDRLIGGLAGPIIAPRSIEMPGKTEQM